MTCKHGFIGACAECDGAGQDPPTEPCEITAPNPHLDPQALLARVRQHNGGFLTPKDVAALASHPQGRLTQVLVRTGRGRFVCAAQDVEHFRALVEIARAGTLDEQMAQMEDHEDWVRDLSLPVANTSMMAIPGLTLTLQTWWLSPLDNEPLGLVREMHVQASELPEVVEQLGDCEQWDYEQYGVTCTYLVLPGGVIDVSRLRPIPQAAERGGPHDPDNTVPSGARAE